MPFDTKIKVGPAQIEKTVAKIDGWTDEGDRGKSWDGELGTIKDSLFVVMEEYMEPGPGGKSTITFNPTRYTVGGVYRPLEVALFHELVHAYYALHGQLLGPVDIKETGKKDHTVLFEVQCVGLPPHFHERPFSENAFRREIRFDLRTSYSA